MQYQSIKREVWNTYLDMVTKTGEGRQMQIEQIGLEIGDQILEDWIPFQGLSFDQNSDTIFVHTDVLEHSIHSPQEIISQENGTVRSITVRQEDGMLQIIHFRDLLQIEKN